MEGFITLHGKDGYGRTTNVLVNLANVCEFREVDRETRILYRDKDKTVSVIEPVSHIKGVVGCVK